MNLNLIKMIYQELIQSQNKTKNQKMKLIVAIKIMNK